MIEELKALQANRFVASHYHADKTAPSVASLLRTDGLAVAGADSTAMLKAPGNCVRRHIDIKNARLNDDEDIAGAAVAVRRDRLGNKLADPMFVRSPQVGHLKIQISFVCC